MITKSYQYIYKDQSSNKNEGEKEEIEEGEGFLDNNTLYLHRIILTIN